MKKEKSKKTITISMPLILILVGGVIILSIVTSYAATMVFDSNNVNYDNTTSGIRSSNVQGAIDELYACASNYSAYDTRLTGTEDIIGNTTLSTTAPTLTGGINELKINYNTLNTNVSNIIRIVSNYTKIISSGTLVANGNGYISVPITIPTGYKTTGISNVVLGHPGMATGLIITGGADIEKTGVTSVYLSYFTPVSINYEYTDFTLFVECIKSDYIIQ